MRLTVAGLKGGPGKTTLAVFLALGLAEHRAQGGRRRAGRVLLVDADPLSQSAMDWRQLAGDTWPDAVKVAAWDDPGLVDLIAEAEHVVFDTGGESDELLRAALERSDEMICPVGPTPAELRRIPATFAAAAAVDEHHPITARVLLTKVRAGTRAAGDARALLEDQGVPVMAAQVSLWQHYVDAYGTAPADLAEYVAVLDELCPVEVPA